MIPDAYRNLAGTLPDQIAHLAIAVAEARAVYAAKLDRATTPSVRRVLEAIPFGPARITRIEIEDATGLPTGTVKEAIAQLRRKEFIAGTARVGNSLSLYWRTA